MTEQVQEYLNGFFLALLWSTCTGAIAWQMGFFRWKEDPFTPPHVQGSAVLKGFGTFLLFQLILMPALAILILSIQKGAFFDERQTPLTVQGSGWMALFTMVGGSIGIFFAALNIDKANIARIWGTHRMFHNLLVGMLTWFFGYPIVMAFGQLISIVTLFLFGQPPIDQVAVEHLKTLMSYPLLLKATSLALVTLVPVIEEWLFRGLLQSWLRGKMSRWGAILLASLLFALFHFSISQGLTNIELLSSLFVLSCFLGYLYERQHSLWAPIGLHAFFNAASVMMILGGDELYRT